MRNRVYRIHLWCLPICLSICLSFCPAVCGQGFRNFLNKTFTWFVSYLAFILMGCASWSLFISVFVLLISTNWSSIFLAVKWGLRIKKNYQLYSFHTWHLLLWGESLDTSSFSIFTVGFGPLVAKYLPEKGVSRIKSNYQVPVKEPWKIWGNLPHGSIKNL